MKEMYEMHMASSVWLIKTADDLLNQYNIETDLLLKEQLKLKLEHVRNRLFFQHRELTKFLEEQE